MVTVQSAILAGTTAIPVTVEVDLLRRLPAMCIVGVPASESKETAERVRSAIEALGEPFEFPRKRVVVNIAPADLRKPDPRVLDLALAVGVLVADGKLPLATAMGSLFVGELALGGDLRPIRGITAYAQLAAQRGLTLVCPAAEVLHAAHVPRARGVGVSTLADVVETRGHTFNGPAGPAPPPPIQTPARPWAETTNPRGYDLDKVTADVLATKGTGSPPTVLLVGEAGSGRTLLARHLRDALGPLTPIEALDSFVIFDTAGLAESTSTYGVRPFRAPHHSVSVPGLLGDRTLRPAEATLSTHGVLFLDEVQEFGRSTLEALRRVLRDGAVTPHPPTPVRMVAEPRLVVLSCNPATERAVTEFWKPNLVVHLRRP